MSELTGLLVDLLKQTLLFTGGPFVHLIQLLLVFFKLLEGPLELLDLILIDVPLNRDLLIDQLSVLDFLFELLYFNFALVQFLLEILVGLLHRLQLLLGVAVLLMDLVEFVALLKERLLLFL